MSKDKDERDGGKTPGREVPLPKDNGGGSEKLPKR